MQHHTLRDMKVSTYRGMSHRYMLKVSALDCFDVCEQLGLDSLAHFDKVANVADCRCKLQGHNPIVN